MRVEVLQRRKLQLRPWHGPPHFTGQQTSQYLITSTCYEHAPIIGTSMERMDDFAAQLYQSFESLHAVIHAWCVLPNHYHVLTTTPDLPLLVTQLGKLHGRMSFAWNGEDTSRGRICWHRVADRAMRSESHFWTTVNYIHHNPVKHGHASKWTEWPWSSAMITFAPKAEKQPPASGKPIQFSTTAQNGTTESEYCSTGFSRSGRTST